METICYFCEDLQLKYKLMLSQRQLRLGVCLAVFALGLPLCTAGGFYLFNLFDTYTYSLASLFICGFNTYLWLYNSDYESLLRQICDSNEEKPPLDYFRLIKDYSFPITLILVVLTVVDIFMFKTQDFNRQYNIIGGVLFTAILSPVVATLIIYYSKPG